MKNISFVNIPEYSTTAARWEAQVDLSNTRYKLNVSWNTCAEAWVMAIMDTNNKLILGGVRLSVGTDLLAKYRASCPELLHGEMWIADLTGRYETAELTRDNFSTRFKLCYGIVEE
jgi:hypothetical protein